MFWRPIIHVAYSDKESSDSSLGIYDLTDPSSALQFAQFILGLQTHRHSYPSPVILSPSSLPQSRNESLPLGNAVQSPTLVVQCKINMTHQKRGKTASCATWKNSRSKWQQTTINVLFRVRRVSLSISSVLPNPRPSPRLGRKAVEGIAPTDKLSWGSYSHDRKVISLAAIDLGPNRSNDTVAVDEINSMKAVYDQLTGYQAPSWENLEDMPSVDKRVNIIRDHFFKQMKDCPRDTTLCFSKMVAQQETNEAEARHDLDFLMYLMYLSQSAITPSRPLLERTISLSQNIVVDSFSEPEFAQSFVTCARESVHLNSRAVESAKEQFTDLSDVFIQAIEAYAASIKHVKAVDSLFESQTVEIDIRSRANIEPKTAVCHIILPFPLNTPQIESEPLIKLAEPKSEDGDAADGSKKGNHQLSVSGPTKSTSSRSLAYIQEARTQKGHATLEENDAEESQSGNLQNPFSVNCSETKDAEPLPPDTVTTVQSLVGLLLLDVLVGEYKKYSNRGFLKALIQTRIYIEASCRHLASLSITDHPVFGLATNGCEGAVLMGWYSQAKDV
ncbi:hypothetical protein IW262DRAFT_1463849 [Armillaria fumosa]|nr:hypothetical protein IW262DRAFT_1463849 [Armillaria fumosa]